MRPATTRKGKTMTAMMIDAPDATEEMEDEQEPIVEAQSKRKRRERDFTKFNDLHQGLADYVNEHSGLDPITPNQVKALLTLRVDFAKLPAQIEQRNLRKAQRQAQKTKYDGMTPEQIKSAKAAERAERHAERLEARVAAAKAKVEELRQAATASGSDLAAAVEAAQHQAVEEENTSSKRRLGRRR